MESESKNQTPIISTSCGNSIRERVGIGSEILCYTATEQWRSKGGAIAGTCPGAQAFGAHQHAFCSHLNTRFKQIFRLKYT